jgi:thiamine-phosphate pyrophosphorylase
MKPLADCHLYTFVDTAYLYGRKPTAVAQALCDGGSDIIQLRAKDLPKPEVARIARDILPITNTAGAWLALNDYPEIAADLGIPACHLGQEDFFDAGLTTVAALRQGKDLRIGLSTHAPDQAARAVAAGADYIGVGPVFATATKPTAKPVTLDYVRWASAHITIPWFAIGGITLENVDDVLAAGARRVCAVSAILGAANIAAACERFQERLISRPL